MTRFRHFRRCRALRIALFVLAFLAPPALAGVVTLYCRLQGTDLLDPAATSTPAPAPRLPATTKRLAVIVAGNRGTEITDTLPIVELLEESDAFEVRVVAPERRLSPFKSAAVAGSGLDFYPDLGFAEYRDLAGDRTPDLIVIPYLTAWQSADAAVIPWIRAHTGPSTTVMSICAGAELAAATGLFDGHAATAHAPLLATLADRHPAIRYRGDVRWVRDGNRISSGTLAAGLDATLAAIDALAGRPAALRAATATGYRHVHFLDDPTWHASVARAGIALEVAFRWERTRVAVVIEDGVSESSLAALLDVYAATMTADSVAVAASVAPIRTRHGLRVVPRGDTRDLGRYDVVVQPAAAAGYDRAIEQVATTHGGPMAKLAAQLVNYPADDLELGGGLPVGVTMIIRALLLGAAGLLVARGLLRSRSGRGVVMKLLSFALLCGLAGTAQAEPKRIEIQVTAKGFDPDTINVAAGAPVTLVFTRTTERTCTKSVVIKLDDKKKIERELPLDKPVEVPVTFPKAGKLGYACSMDMNKGVIVVQ